MAVVEPLPRATAAMASAVAVLPSWLAVANASGAAARPVPDAYAGRAKRAVDATVPGGYADAPTRAQPVKVLAVAAQAAVHGRGQPVSNALKMRQPFLLVRAQHLGGRGRCRGARVRGHVGDGEIGFVSHAADDRDRAGVNGARHDLFVERP